MSHKQMPFQDIDAGLARVEKRIEGRRAAGDVSELIGDSLADAHFLASFVETLQRMHGPPPEPVEPAAVTPIGRLGATVLPFGCHSGKTFDETPLDYLDWLCRSQEDFYASLRAYLKHPDLDSRRRGLHG